MSDTFRTANAVTSTKRVYMRDRDMAEFEKELETSRLNTENANKPQETVEQQPSVPVVNTENPNSANKSQESVDWQKRYSDLQSHTTKQINEAKKRETDLENKLKEQAKSKPKYPTSEEELAQWCKEFPPLLPIIQTIALKATEGDKEELKKEIEELRQFQQAYVNDKGRLDLLKIHPDANDIEADPKFAQWFNEQEPEIQALINSGEPKKIGKAITLYKKEFGIVTKTVQDLQKEASKAINVGPSSSSIPQEQKVWHESEVAKLPAKVYARFEREIETARTEGRYVYDVSRAS